MYSIFIGLGNSLVSTKASPAFLKDSPPIKPEFVSITLSMKTNKNNVNTYMNIYTGGGVAAGDVNNDGLTDLFFSGNMVTSRLYLNKGNLQFEDITESSGIVTTHWGNRCRDGRCEPGWMA